MEYAHGFEDLGRLATYPTKTVLLAIALTLCASHLAGGEPAAANTATIPNDWVDTSTGHRVIRLSRREGANQSFYFHNYPFFNESRAGDGDKMVFYGSTPNGRQLFSVNLKTLKIEQLTTMTSEGFFGGINGEITAPKRREAIYACNRVIYGTNVDTLRTRTIVRLPADFRGSPSTVNADETLLAGAWSDRSASGPTSRSASGPGVRKSRGASIEATFAEHRLNHLFTINTQSGEIKEIHRDNNWLNHHQFSPTDPNLLMFCHEGPWHLLDRIWVIRTDGTGRRLMHKRTVDREIAGHEFWSPDGQRIWFDLQIPRGETFFLAGVDLKTGEEIRYPVTRDQWSVHFNISRDGKLFCGDGGSAGSVARAKDGKWIYLFRPQGDKLQVERLVNLARHDYELEPNVHFTPDTKWVVFRSNMHGPSQVYAVEVEKAGSGGINTR